MKKLGDFKHCAKNKATTREGVPALVQREDTTDVGGGGGGEGARVIPALNRGKAAGPGHSTSFSDKGQTKLGKYNEKGDNSNHR